MQVIIGTLYAWEREKPVKALPFSPLLHASSFQSIASGLLVVFGEHFWFCPFGRASPEAGGKACRGDQPKEALKYIPCVYEHYLASHQHFVLPLICQQNL
jgi:hypothetical protein